MRKILCLGLVLAMAALLGGCDLFNDLGGRDEVPNYQNGLLANNKIELNGGNATYDPDKASASYGYGGDGGYFGVESTGVDSIHMNPEGEVDASFELPAYDADADLGPTGLVVSSSIEVEVLGDHGEAESGEVYMLYGDIRLYKRLSETAGDYVEVSGLRVNDGKTLTLNPNDGEGRIVTLDFDYDVDIRGQVTTTTYGGIMVLIAPEGRADTYLNRCALQIGASRIFVRETGSIITKGLNAADGSNMYGGDGGAVNLMSYFGVFSKGKIDVSGGHGDGEGSGGDAGYIYESDPEGPSPSQVGFEYVSGIYMYADYGIVLNQGRLYLNGGDGYYGGNGNLFIVEAYRHVFNTGDVQANGGEGEQVSGGHGGGISLWAYLGSAFNSGNLTANGGVGNGGSGGSGGSFGMWTGDEGYEEGYLGGKIVNSGNVQASGGNGLSGGGGAFYFQLQGLGKEEIIQKGSVIMNGGACTGETGYGGGGPEIIVQKYFSGMYSIAPDVDESEDIFENDINVTWFGKVEANGGYGPSGGGAGEMYIYNGYFEGYGPVASGAYIPDNFTVNLFGFARVEANGGQGCYYGGSGGWVELIEYLGDVLASVDIQARGGKATDGNGGSGGYVMMMGGYAFLDYDGDSPIPPNLDDLEAVVAYNGDMDLRGGDGVDEGGQGGAAMLIGWEGAAVKGKILTSGGNGIGENSDGGCAGDGVPRSARDIVNWESASIVIAAYRGDAYASGNFIAKGGDAKGEAQAGDGGAIAVGAAGHLKSVVDYDVRGGSADSEYGEGGNGGIIDIFSYGQATEHHGSAKISGGSGYDAGEEGAFLIDEVLIDGELH